MPVILKREAIEYLNKVLLLPYIGTEQDWELELANPGRLEEFLIYYKSEPLSKDIKIALMSLILASYDDHLNKKNLSADETWEEIQHILEPEKETFNELIDYWSVNGENDPENYFTISPLIRKIRRD